MMPASTAKLDDLSLKSQLKSSQLNQITTELDLVMIALAAIAQVSRGEITQIAQDLQLESLVLDWLNEWPLSRSTPPQQLDVEQLKALVLIVNRLAQAHQALVRQNINYWQQTIQSDRLPLQSPSLAEYIGNFITIYQTRRGKETSPSFDTLSDAAMSLLLELLFYGSPKGHQLLWGALLQRSDSAVIAPVQFKPV